MLQVAPGVASSARILAAIGGGSRPLGAGWRPALNGHELGVIPYASRGRGLDPRSPSSVSITHRRPGHVAVSCRTLDRLRLGVCDAGPEPIQRDPPSTKDCPTPWPALPHPTRPAPTRAQSQTGRHATSLISVRIPTS